MCINTARDECVSTIFLNLGPFVTRSDVLYTVLPFFLFFPISRDRASAGRVVRVKCVSVSLVPQLGLF